MALTFTCGLKKNLLRFFAFYVNNLTLGHDKLKICSCILPKFVMHVSSDQFSDNLNEGRKKIRKPDLLRFFAFYVNNLTLLAQ